MVLSMPQIIRVMFILLALLPLGGCLSPYEQEINRIRAMRALEDTCAGYGFEPDTSAMATCKMRLAEGAKTRAAVRSTAPTDPLPPPILPAPFIRPRY